MFNLTLCGLNIFHILCLKIPKMLRPVHTVMVTIQLSLFWCHCHCCNEWVQYLFMMTMATEKIGIVATDCGVHIVAATENKKKRFDLTCLCHRSVNEP